MVDRDPGALLRTQRHIDEARKEIRAHKRRSSAKPKELGIVAAELDFIELCSIGESVCHAVRKVSGNFYDLGGLRGCVINLLSPEFAADGGDSVAECWVGFWIPCSGPGDDGLVLSDVVRPECDEGEEAQEGWGGAQDGEV